ncbi:hypothetical protein PHLGIDRAFT_9838 [Phlebiopsis gigantea 11061_1 CR5-6]|uniref:NADH dehydrogenase [ubiquinone] 1 beta subcomplex subunit 9 n=1 Tax=Phlebiopsis gigantea (strain 11061_1 CR5-6) TaxID=745531 RepID=A0A0C3PXE8_PHLG1|nr:hypothetical protein PHLGIDRAFT_9838 [Phlebiopsis gigantea 11061_1 CR5-6]
MSTPVPVAPFSAAHKSYVKNLYRRILTNELNWTVRRDIWRGKALAIRAEFDRHRDVQDPRALAELFDKAEAELSARLHPDPYRPATAPDGTKWERNAPPPLGPLFDHRAYNDAHAH